MIVLSATLPIKYRQSGPEKIAQSLMHSHFATVCSRITGLKNCTKFNTWRSTVEEHRFFPGELSCTALDLQLTSDHLCG